MEKMLNLVLFGPPGAGKGTQSQKLIDKYALVHVSTGDILRGEIARGTSLGRRAKEIMDRGELVSDDIVIGMIESTIDQNHNAKGFIFDGFPRTQPQAVALDDLLQKKGTGISAMIALEVNDEELVKRLLLRGKDSGRSDDQDEQVIRRRIQEYNNKTLPLKKYYGEQGKFHSIHGIGTIDEIFNALVSRITFLKAEMDLTALESDIEHLDLTISDYEIASDIEPELLLEIDAIKRAEAEEEAERRSALRKAKKVAGVKEISRSAKPKAGPKKAKKQTAKKKAARKTTASKPKKAARKSSAEKASPKKKMAKKLRKPGAKNSAGKAAAPKKAVRSKKSRR